MLFFFFSSRRRHTRLQGDWSSDVCSSDLAVNVEGARRVAQLAAEQESRLVMIGGYMLKNNEHLQRIGIDPGHPELTDWPAIYRQVGAYEASKLEAHFATLGFMKIGRASCRERV